METFTLTDFKRLPTVFVDRHPSTIERGAVCVTSDSVGIARAAARELLAYGLSDYAYVDWFQPQVWSDERGDAFARLVAENGKRLMRHRLLRPSGKSCQSDLAKWLKTLPRPCGIFAVNDRTAGCVVSAAQKTGLDVPQDLLVVGVDNDTLLCENSPVPISSVPLDRDGGGRLAAELLDAQMQGRRSARSGLIGALPLVRRASSRRFADARVSAAVEFIRLHACDGANVDDVVRQMNCSRSLAYMRFGEAVGHTILDEIQAVRLARAKELLADRRQSVQLVSDRCGYASAVDFRRAFKRMTGCTPKRWANPKG